MTMAIEAGTRDLAQRAPTRRRACARPLLAVLLATALVGILLSTLAPPQDGFALRDNDDRMRMVQVRDWLEGQPFTDLDQHRLGPGASDDGPPPAANAVAAGGGTRMHWSRIVDLPVAATIVTARWLGASDPERVAAIVAPMVPLPLLLGALCVGALALARLCTPGAARDGAAGIVLLVLAMGAVLALTSNRFVPYALDHHNWQMTLSAVTVAGLLHALAPHPSSRTQTIAAIVAALALSLSIAIGMEALPMLVAAVAGLVLVWLTSPTRQPEANRAAFWFGLALAGASLAAFAAFVPPARWWPAACDAFSMAHLPVLVAGGLGLALSARLAGGATLPRRIGALALVAVACIAGGWPLLEACAGGAYSFQDPRIRSLWLDEVGEAQPLWRVAAFGRPFLWMLVPLCAGLVASAVMVRRGGVAAFVIVLPLVVATALALWQVRAWLGAWVLLPIPLGVAAAVLLQRGPAWRALGLATVLAGVPPAWNTLDALIATPDDVLEVTAPGTAGDCTSRAVFGPVAAMAPTIVMAGSDQGSHMLLHTPHRVLSGPYHRNVAGFTALFDTMATDLASARRTLAHHGATHLLVCASGPELRLHARAAPDGLAAALVRGRTPAWLRLDASRSRGALRLYEVVSPAS